MAFGDLGTKITGVVGDVVVLVIMLALAVSLSPLAVGYLTDLGAQMQGQNSTLVQTLGTILVDFGPVIWYGSLMGGSFAAIYDLVRRFFKTD